MGRPLEGRLEAAGMGAAVPPDGGEGGNSISAGLRINIVPLALALILLLAILAAAAILPMQRELFEQQRFRVLVAGIARSR